MGYCIGGEKRMEGGNVPVEEEEEGSKIDVVLTEKKKGERGTYINGWGRRLKYIILQIYIDMQYEIHKCVVRVVLAFKFWLLHLIKGYFLRENPFETKLTFLLKETLQNLTFFWEDNLKKFTSV